MANEGRKHMFHSDANKETDADTQIRIGLGIARIYYITVSRDTENQKNRRGEAITERSAVKTESAMR